MRKSNLTAFVLICLVAWVTVSCGGGPGRDEIAPIDAPMFLNVAENPRALDKEEPVIVLEIDGEAKAYPLRILIWHEIVNDELVLLPDGFAVLGIIPTP